MPRIVPLTHAEATGTGTPPPFARIAIVGYGLIGGSLGLAVKARWPSALVIAVDRKDVIETAMRMHAADVGGDDLVMIADAELIVLAAPVRTNIDILARLADYAPRDGIVTDVGSTKRDVMAAARALPPRLRFIGGHPLSGAAASGVEMARPDLFVGRPWILTPDVAAPEDVERLSDWIEGLGSSVHLLSPDAHDLLVAAISHLPQLTASALMHVVGERAGAEGLALAGRGLRDTTRLASSPAAIWRDIAATNPDNIGAALDALIAALQQMKSDLTGSNGALARTLESAGGWKQTLDRHFEQE